MLPESDVISQLRALRIQHDALALAYVALQNEKSQQEIATQAWIQQRKQELEAEALEQRRAATLQRVFYEIAERSAAGLSFYNFLQAVHALLGELIYAKNCFVCLYDARRQVLSFPYYVDERDGDSMQCDDVPCRRGLTEFVLRTRQPQLIDAERFARLKESGEITEATGDLSFVTWLGVPMQIRGEIGGVLAVQSYEAGIHYSPVDANILSYVANHVSSAIERYQALEGLRKSEQRYRSVIENVGVGVVVVQDGRMVFANPSMERIVGHSMQFLLSNPFTATVHPEDVEAMVARHHRRLRGESVESQYSFRIITEAGEVRTLELSAVMIDWGDRVATLMFVVDATARLKAEFAQRQMVQRQSELNSLKSRFISMASHEFRTPLATIHGSVELLQHYEDRLSPDRKKLTLEKIGEAVQRMTHMLENVLVIGRADAGQLEFKPQALAIGPFCLVLLDELASSHPQARSRVQLKLDLPPPDVLFSLDETLIRNIAGNLLSNAFKYSPQGGEVTFSVCEQGSQLLMVVADQGIGIPEVDIPHLFESFHRASNVGPIAGTGLGLSIVKEAVACHGGSIEVQSRVGQGSRFVVSIPIYKSTD